jgi:protein phosphatase
MKIEAAGLTDKGIVRDHNEDAFAIERDGDFMVVCDGMGGHAAGEVASRIAVETICQLVKENDVGLFDNKEFKFPADVSAEGKLLVGSIAIANQRVFDYSNRNPELSGMGTTVVACRFHSDLATICHVGDSRAYLLRDGELRQLTVDHSWVSELMQKHNISEEESKNYVNSNVITRALGTKQVIKTDISELPCKTGDIFLLCSDGLTGMVSEESLRETMAELAERPQDLSAKLVELANQGGGTDNITVCVGAVKSDSGTGDLSEVKTMTVDWGDGDEIEGIYQIIDRKFSEDLPATDTVVTDIDKTAPTPKKKSSPLTIVLTILLIVTAIVAVAYLLAPVD